MARSQRPTSGLRSSPKRLAAKVGLAAEPGESQFDLLKKLENAGAISGEVARLFHSIRKTGNDAVHGVAGDREEAETTLRMAHTLAVWFMRACGGNATSSFFPSCSSSVRSWRR